MAAGKLSTAVKQREREVRPFIEKYADLFDLDPNLVRALITQESRFVAEATSPTGAYGLGQFTGIGAKQVKNIAAMTEKAADLHDFEKREADEPDRGIKAICATLWWLFHRKYRNVADKKVQLEAVLTFYNAGGRPAALVVKHGGHKQALPHIKELPSNFISQSPKYAPEVALWYVAWHEELQPRTGEGTNPFDVHVNPPDVEMDRGNKTLIDFLLFLEKISEKLDVRLHVREGFTEVTIIVPGEYE